MDSVFFWVAKLTWLVISPDTLLLGLVLVGAVAHWRRRYRAAGLLFGTAAALMLLIALVPVGNWLLRPLEQVFPANPPLPGQVDGIVVLGGSEHALLSDHWGQAELNDSAERHLAMLALARRYPQARLVYTGGSGSMVHQSYKESAVAERLYREQGLDLARVMFEGASRNTYENARNARKLANPAATQTWLLVTSAAHMPRAAGVFCRAGWPVIAYPVDHWTAPATDIAINLDFAGHLRTLKNALREWLGLAAYYFSGKTLSLLPRGCAQTVAAPD